ncbi:TolC family outer membrane protein [Andreprevotia chitinilytica]|uniref:TolC family outer membrane protein n=1 Tax=Andreprevotia chitinilytica TaxID=396808 RepID=UPI00146FF08C|nr:TolC family outer membrane protein [Andreprevotia chitinilytica]
MTHIHLTAYRLPTCFTTRHVVQAVLLALCGAAVAGSAQALTLNEAVGQAVTHQPDTRSRMYDYLAAGHEEAAAKARYLPRVDLQGAVGHEWQRSPITDPVSFNHPSVGIQLRETVFDGFFREGEIRRLGYARQTRLYEALAVSDQTASDAAKAYYDVLRYRKLVSLAQDNYATHKEIHDQIQERVKAGVGRRVDLEQAAGRLALAESNWLIEVSNADDVSARYARIIGSEPVPDMLEPENLEASMPKPDDLLANAIKNNPSFLAAIANIRSARAKIETQKANNYPVIEFQASKAIDDNRNGINGRYHDAIVQLTLNWNLYNGGADLARTRQSGEEYNKALEQRDVVCRDVRQTTQIAFNDVNRLREQYKYMDQHQLSTEKARDAYRKQFDIGQRTLLDVLDSENELFDAKRTLVNADYDQRIAVVRLLAQTHTLLPTLKLNSLVDGEQPEQLKDVKMEDEQIGCSTALPAAGKLDREAAMIGRAPVAPLPAKVEEPAPAVKAAPAPAKPMRKKSQSGW